MKISVTIPVLVLLIFTACTKTNTSNSAVSSAKPFTTVTQEKTWDLMSGKWYGSQPTIDGGIKRHIIERSTQGTYQVAFRIYDNEGRYKEQFETGQWGVSGPIYFTIFRGWLNEGELSPADSDNPYNYDAYKIVKLTNEEFEYESYSSGSKFLVNKVASDFEFPID